MAMAMFNLGQRHRHLPRRPADRAVRAIIRAGAMFVQRNVVSPWSGRPRPRIGSAFSLEGLIGVFMGAGRPA